MTDLAVENEFIISEDHLSADISDFDYNVKFYVSTTDTSSSCVSSVVSGNGTIQSLFTVPQGYAIPFVKISPKGLLCVGDMKESGIWIFDTNKGDEKKTASAIYTRIPPSDIAFMK
jgi:hypothetical protein